MSLRIVEGDLLDQETDAIVNAWNRNIIPWWLLLPQGVSGAIKRRAGTAPFRELARKGAIPLGRAVATGAGMLPYKAIIHVAGINMLWRASRGSIVASVRSAIEVARALGLRSIAFPIIGAGSGGFPVDEAEAIMRKEIEGASDALEVIIVRFVRGPASARAGSGLSGTENVAPDRSPATVVRNRLALKGPLTSPARRVHLLRHPLPHALTNVGLAVHAVE